MFDACPAPEDRPCPVETRAERRMRRLSRLADIGLSIAEKLERQAELAAVHAEVDAVPDNLPHSKRLDEIGRTFAQVSRAVSLATALEDRIDKGLPALPDDDRAVRECEAREKRAEVARAVVNAIDTDPTVRSRRRVVQLRLNLDRLLDAELADLDRFLRRPFHELEARLRRDLGLETDDDDLAGSAGVPPASRFSGQARGGSPRSGCGGEATTSPPPRGTCAGVGPRSGGGGDERSTIQAQPPHATRSPTRVFSRPDLPGPLHRHSTVPLPRSSAAGEEKTLPP